MEQRAIIEIVGQAPDTPEYHKGRVEWASRHLREARLLIPQKFQSGNLELCKLEVIDEIDRASSRGSGEHHYKTRFAHDDAQAEMAIMAMLTAEFGYAVQKRPFPQGDSAGLGFYIVWP